MVLFMPLVRTLSMHYDIHDTSCNEIHAISKTQDRAGDATLTTPTPTLECHLADDTETTTPTTVNDWLDP